MQKPLLIGIAGGTASGKTTVANKIYEAFAGLRSVALISQDCYYFNQDHVPMEERVHTNYDHPHAFDFVLMKEQLEQLLRNEAIEQPMYDYVNHTRRPETTKREPRPIIILEGLYALENVEIRKLLDIKIFVDADADTRFIRRLERDTAERGRSMKSVIQQYLSTVKTMHEQFIEPTKKYAHIIIPNGGENTVAIELLITHIETLLKNSGHLK